MELTKRFIKAKSPCADGFRWLLRHHPQGNDYQALLDALVADGRVDDACWLLTQFGPTSAVLQLDHFSGLALVFAGSVEVRRDIDAHGLVRAGRSLRAGGAIRAGGIVSAGEAIVAGGVIEATSVDAGGDLQAGALHIEGPVRARDHLRITRDLVCQRELKVGAQASVGGVMQVRGDVQCGHSLRVRCASHVSGHLRAGDGVLTDSDLHCERHLDAGWGIKAGGDITAGGAIRAGESLSAPGAIRAGEGYGVYAGLCVPREDWATSARVSASHRPERLLSGWWAGDGASDHDEDPNAHHAHRLEGAT
jgi:hypothetical protein